MIEMAASLEIHQVAAMLDFAHHHNDVASNVRLPKLPNSSPGLTGATPHRALAREVRASSLDEDQYLVLENCMCFYGIRRAASTVVRPNRDADAQLTLEPHKTGHRLRREVPLLSKFAQKGT
jgi:hypothetical protein